MTRTILALTLALVLVPIVGDAATLRTSLPTHLPAPRRTLSPIRHVQYHARAPTTQPRRGHRETVAPEAIHVHDGDTFYVGPDAFRIRGIDTPELGQPRAEAARQRLLALLRTGPVTIVRQAEDVYGRVVADVFVGGRSVARILKAEGYAKPRAPASRRVRQTMYRSLDIPMGRGAWDVR
jgi:endonuclease YncB( thermonuclease family)